MITSIFLLNNTIRVLYYKFSILLKRKMILDIYYISTCSNMNNISNIHDNLFEQLRYIYIF